MIKFLNDGFNEQDGDIGPEFVFAADRTDGNNEQGGEWLNVYIKCKSR